MPRRLIIALALLVLSPVAPAQGIRGVTQRTTTLERQLPARQFFDGAGVNVNGAPPIGTTTPTAVATRQPPVLATRPPIVLPPISQRIARPQVVQTRPVGIPTTPRVTPPKPVPVKSHAKP